jgi:uncharacterized Rossmann fold enzyme
MKKHKKNLIKSNLPLGLKRAIEPLLLFIAKPQYRAWRKNHSRRLLKFKDIHRGKSCFIIGNGPSLNKMDLAPLNSHYTFGMNKIFLMFDKIKLHISYYVASQPDVLEQSKKEIEAMKCPCFVPYCPGWKKTVIDLHDHVYYIMTHGSGYTFQQNLVRPLWSGYTVTYVALQLAYFMGFKRVFLIGVDHYYVTEEKPPCSTEIYQGDDINHFHPGYFKDQKWELPNLAGSEFSYKLAKTYFEKDGREIYDATVNGKLMVFPKIEYDKALKIIR